MKPDLRLIHPFSDKVNAMLNYLRLQDYLYVNQEQVHYTTASGK